MNEIINLNFTKLYSLNDTEILFVPGKSLYDLIAPGKYTKTNLNIQSDWKGLLSGSGCASLQTKCTKQGINVYTKMSAARIGVLGDEVANCHNPDSYIGFGTQGSSCGRNPLTSCGNEAGCGADQGNRRTQAMGYIYVY